MNSPSLSHNNSNSNSDDDNDKDDEVSGPDLEEEEEENGGFKRKSKEDEAEEDAIRFYTEGEIRFAASLEPKDAKYEKKKMHTLPRNKNFWKRIFNHST